MIMMLSFSFILFGIVAYLYGKKQSKAKTYFLYKKNESKVKSEIQAVDVKSLNGSKRYKKVQDTITPALSMLGDRAFIIVFSFMLIVTSASWYINSYILKVESYWFVIILPCVLLFIGWSWLVKKRKSEFEQTFPDALNIMMSAVSAGDSLMKAISYVGESMDNKIGREFKLMGERMKLGESPDVVFQRASNNYPYPAFLFFVVTIRANMSRGGQLKHVLARLIRVLVDSRTLEKKKMAMTSEARISAKIVAAIPFSFMILLNYISPQNVDFILTDPEGRIVLYYVLGSEAFGLFIVWLLVRGVK
jgi:tight adherence protein B